MKTNVVISKGIIYVNYTLKGLPPKRLSTGIRIEKELFDELFDKSEKCFGPTNRVPFRSYNNIIDEKLKENPFEVIAKLERIENDLIAYFESSKQTINESSRTTYKATFAKLKKDFGTLPIESLDSRFRDNFINSLKAEGNKPTTISNKLTQINTIINKYNDENGTNFKNLKKGLKKIHSDKAMLSDNDIEILKSIRKGDKYYNEVILSLVQLFGNGLRFSEGLFLRVNDFKQNEIKIHTTKSKKKLTVPYSLPLLVVLHRYLREVSVIDESYYDNLLLVGYTEKQFNDLKKEVLEALKKRKNTDLIFPSLLKNRSALQNYYPINEFSTEQVVEFNRVEIGYIKRLKTMARRYGLSIEPTTHSFRYKFVGDCLSKNVNIAVISKCLGHSSITITDNYIKRNFDLENLSYATEVMNSMYGGNLIKG